MARQQQRLSALQVSKLTKLGLYGDGGGLTLQITATGAKSWLLRYMVAGKPFGMGLGPTHTVSLAEARQKALEARKLARWHQPFGGQEAKPDRRRAGRRQDDEL